MPSDHDRSHPTIPATGLRGRDGHEYVPDESLLAAANAALAVQMPLLLTGDAGCGKTDFAYAAAGALARDGETGEPLECYVRSDSRARDLLYSYDAIRRFGDAQHGGEEGKRRAEDARNYVHLNPLGTALMSENLRVVLIDEIDKAPRDLPNDLLRELDQGRFAIPEITDAQAPEGAASIVRVDDPRTYRNTMVRPNPNVRPFVIITSNVERQLPDPFLRRCVFFHIPFPDTDALHRILEAHLRDPGRNGEPPLPTDLLAGSLDVFMRIRRMPSLKKRPATSELISWVRALARVFGPDRARAAIEPFRREDTSLRGLPALGCLIKLREDMPGE